MVPILQFTDKTKINKRIMDIFLHVQEIVSLCNPQEYNVNFHANLNFRLFYAIEQWNFR